MATISFNTELLPRTASSSQMTADSIVTSAQIDVYPSDSIQILGYNPRSLNVAKLRPHRWAFSAASHVPNLAMPSAGRNGPGVWGWVGK